SIRLSNFKVLSAYHREACSRFPVLISVPPPQQTAALPAPPTSNTAATASSSLDGCRISSGLHPSRDGARHSETIGSSALNSINEIPRNYVTHHSTSNWDRCGTSHRSGGSFLISNEASITVHCASLGGRGRRRLN